MVKILTAMTETHQTQVWSLGQEDPLENETAIHSSILVWRILWTEKHGRLQPTGSQRVRHEQLTLLLNTRKLFLSTHSWYSKWEFLDLLFLLPNHIFPLNLCHLTSVPTTLLIVFAVIPTLLPRAYDLIHWHFDFLETASLVLYCFLSQEH